MHYFVAGAMTMWRLLVLVVVSCGYVAACPEGCSCNHDQGVYSASCSVLPYNGGKVEALTVQPSHPRTTPLELADGQFNQARHLKYLNLGNNSIYFIHKKAFYGVKGLVEIDLSYNFIEELDPMLFQHLSSLTTLTLRGNSIQLIPGVPFVVSNSIQHLDIGQCRLKSIPRGIFYGLKRLRYLSLDGNLLKSLKYNSLPKGLKYLNLSQNLIVNVPSEVLSSLSNLRRISLGENPINCSCSLMNLQDWLSGRGVIFEDNVVCALPQEYSGTSWSKVDENKLCLAEARRDEISLSTPYSKMFKNKFTKDKYFQNENSYSEENLQSDQPHLIHSNTQSEILFQNDETVAMGEMMRDQEYLKDLNVNEMTIKNESGGNKTGIAEIAVFTEATNIYESPTVKSESSLDSDKDEGKQNVSMQANDNNENGLDKQQQQNAQEKKLELNKEFQLSHQNSTQYSQSEIHVLNSTELVTLNENSTVEFKETDGGEVDMFKQEGLLVDSNKYTSLPSATLEESTDDPETEDTTEDEEASTQETLTSDNDGVGNVDEDQTRTSTFIPEINVKTHTEIEISETVPPPVVISELTKTDEASQNFSQLSVPSSKIDTELAAEPHDNPENRSFADPSKSTNNNAMEQKIKEVAGAEVLMFCIGVLVITLVLYSVYKCRSSKKRQTVRVNKDMEANRGTEMQDMASLLPKPQDDDKKHNLKYPNETPSSENVKLLTKTNENENSSFKIEDTAANKLQERNSLNNNTASPNSKTLLLKPGNPIAINPSAPIQRTKVKVSIIPDSIPRTPIFVQKTYNNGTKHV